MTKQCSKYFCLLIRHPYVSLLKYLSKALRGKGLGYTQQQSAWPAHRPWVWLLPSLSSISSWLVVVSLAWFSRPFWWWPEPSWVQGRAYWAGPSCFAPCFTGLIAFLLMHCQTYVYALDANHFSYVWSTNISLCLCQIFPFKGEGI